MIYAENYSLYYLFIKHKIVKKYKQYKSVCDLIVSLYKYILIL